MIARGAALAGLTAAMLASLAPPASAADEAVERGAYIFHAAGCKSCHTVKTEDAPPLAGGRALATPFGVFHTPNITPDPETGLGRWSEADFLAALRQGRAPDGSPYYPAFPYTSYHGVTDADARDLWAYLQTVEPVTQANLPHELDFPFSLRWLTNLWRWLYFDPEGFVADPGRSEVWNRGAYLVRHLGHCAECHSPRGLLGAVEDERQLAGNPKGPDGKRVPNITPDEEDGIGKWSKVDITFFLNTGFLPDWTDLLDR